MQKHAVPILLWTAMLFISVAVVTTSPDDTKFL